MARALYSDADICLLDDPLSGFEPRLAKSILKDCIHGHLKQKLVVMATHNRQFLRSFDRVLLLQDGCIIRHGNFDQIFYTGFKNINSAIVRETSWICLSREDVGASQVQLQFSSEPLQDQPVETVMSIDDIVGNHQRLESELQRVE